jgi:hypothetical protein
LSHSLIGVYDINCKKVDHCLQFIGIKIVQQFFFRGKPSDSLVGPDPVVVVDQTFHPSFGGLKRRSEFSYATSP